MNHIDRLLKKCGSLGNKVLMASLVSDDASTGKKKSEASKVSKKK